ncbi:hypothetical protein NIES4075_69810 [Tolypothrix sp. NIES-4075]|uniref:hypothetical protein n=1 Tax=Tolypothrix sp. NIES-4075 TaxID=2005459 RepID=UPI000B5CA00D|nr:hypothetical protein [Tolypothrix sp. NIES-4075]GAX45960.1 hypothetical protein NIES4075_69810 [Tolypothrix sp. NIES-4075]
MSQADFEKIIDDYRKNAYSQAVEDFFTAFELCEFHSYELLYALSDIFQKRGLDEIATYLSHAAESIPLNSEALPQFKITARLDEEQSQ